MANSIHWLVCIYCVLQYNEVAKPERSRDQMSEVFYCLVHLIELGTNHNFEMIFSIYGMSVLYSV